MKADLSFVGKRLPPVGANFKATGAAKYSVDIKLPGMLVGKILGSPYAHANIKKIDKSVAEKLPGVEAVLTFDNVPQIPFNPAVEHWSIRMPHEEICDMYMLTNKARFVGDVIAAVAAVDEATAIKALSLLEVEYEVLPAVFDLVEAMKPGAPVVHDFAQNNVSVEATFPMSRGDVEAGFKEADVVVEQTHRTVKQDMMRLEPCSCVASFDPDGNLTVWAALQRPFPYRKKLAELFDLPDSKINMIVEYGGGFFGETYWSPLPITVALAMKACKPVKLEYTREETAIVNPHREVFLETGKIGLKKDGTLTAMQQDIIYDSGAYFNLTSTTSSVNMGSFTGFYRCANVLARMKGVYSNTPYSGGNRGYGAPGGVFLVEQLMDEAAEKLGMDPIELRIKNLKHQGELGLLGPVETETQESVLRLGAERIGWNEKRARNREVGGKRYGVGMATYLDCTGAQPVHIYDRHVMMQLSEDGQITVLLNHADGGMNLLGAMSQIAAEVLGVRCEDIHFVHSSTRDTLWDPGIAANSGTYTVGNAMIKAATALKAKIIAVAADKLRPAYPMSFRVPVDDLDIEDGVVFVKNNPTSRIRLSELANSAIYNHIDGSNNIFVQESYQPTANPSSAGVVFVDVEVDTETGEVKIAKLVTVHDCGRAINPMTVEGQLQGGVTLGIGAALFEESIINPQTGALETANYNTYKIPSTMDMPDLEVVVFEEPTPTGPFGAKSVGQSGFYAVGPAVANAVYDAVGVRLYQHPLTPERLLAAIKAKQAA
jgi:xanthine dehydrogenase molybdenum-binding subunit